MIIIHIYQKLYVTLYKTKWNSWNPSLSTEDFWKKIFQSGTRRWCNLFQIFVAVNFHWLWFRVTGDIKFICAKLTRAEKNKIPSWCIIIILIPVIFYFFIIMTDWLSATKDDFNFYANIWHLQKMTISKTTCDWFIFLLVSRPLFNANECRCKKKLGICKPMNHLGCVSQIYFYPHHCVWYGCYALHLQYTVLWSCRWLCDGACGTWPLGMRHDGQSI